MIIIDTRNLINQISVNALKSIAPKEGGEAGWMCERIIKSIQDFEKDLPYDHQAGGKLVNFQNVTFSIDDVGYWGPDMIMFYGTLPDGSRVQLLQHITQLNLLLVSVPRKDDLEQPRRKIGFETSTSND